MVVDARRRVVSGIGVAAASALLVGALSAPAAAQEPPAAPPPAAAPAQGEVYVPPAQVTRTQTGADPTGTWTPTATLTPGPGSTAANPAAAAVAADSTGASGLAPAAAQASAVDPGVGTAAGSGLGVQPFYGLESFPLSDNQAAQVNLATGNLVVRSTDVALNSPGVPLRIDRFYNSLSTGTGTFGARTVASTGRDVGLQITPTQVTFVGPSGFTAVFGVNPDGTFSTPAGINADLERVGPKYKLTYRATNENLWFSDGGLLFLDNDAGGTGLTGFYNPDQSNASIRDAAGRFTAFFSTSSRIDTIVDPALRQVRYTYDQANNLTSVIDQAGDTTRYTYNPAGQMTATQTAGGNWTAFGYDTSGRVTSVTRYLTPGAQTGPAQVTGFAYGTGVTTQTNPLGHASTYALDGQGRVTQVTDPLGRSRSVTWTPNSDLATAVDAMGSGQNTGNTTTYTYDQANNLTAVSIPTGAAARAQYGQTNSCNNNAGGQPYRAKCTTDPQGNNTGLTYDGMGHVARAYDTATGADRRAEYEGALPFEPHCGAKVGQLCRTFTPYGAVTSYEYTPSGEVARVVPPGPLGATRYAYDSLSRLISVTDGKNQTTTYAYDAADRLLRTGYADGTQVTRTYDRDGQLLTTTDTSGANQAYTYDTLGRQTSSTVPGAAPNTSTVAYDLAGNTTSVTDRAGTVTYTYDAANQLVALAEPGGTCPTTGAGTRCTRFGYDNNGARTTTTYPGGTTQTAVRDNSGRATQLKVTAPGGQVLSDLGYTYTTAAGTTGDRTVLQSRATTVSTTDGAPIGIPNGAATAYKYNSLGLLTQARETKPGGAPNANWNYGYDNSGNRTQVETTNPAGQVINNLFGYNGADQLINRNIFFPQGWAYDANGNQTSAPFFGGDGMGPASPNNQNTVNPRDQVTVTTSDGRSTPFSYAGDTNNQRLTAGTTSYQNSVLGQVSQATGGQVTAFTRTPGGKLVSMRTGATSLYYLTDIQGTVIGIVNDQGQKVAGYAYGPYGEPRSTTGPSAETNPYRYTGGYLDPSSGLIKLGYRYYDTRQGRFTQQDPAGQEANAYLYAAGDPINFRDSLGLAVVNDGGGNYVPPVEVEEESNCKEAATLGVIGAVGTGAGVGTAVTASTFGAGAAVGLATTIAGGVYGVGSAVKECF